MLKTQFSIEQIKHIGVHCKINMNIKNNQNIKSMELHISLLNFKLLAIRYELIISLDSETTKPVVE
jgi:hypothetical protein